MNIQMEGEIPKFKVIFLGDQGVGKSCIINRFVQDRYEPNYQATIGMDFHSKNVKIDNQDVRLLLFDTAGQEKFRSLIPMYIRDANIVILVYDITSKRFKMNFKLDKESFKHVTTHWLDQIKDFKKNDAIFALVGNKLDLSDSKEVTREEALAVAKEKKFIFHEVSALSGENINSLFYKDIFDQIVNQFRVSMDDNEEKEQNNIQLTPHKKDVSKNRKCC